MLELLKATLSEWQEDKASRLAAALAYYTVFSLAPLLIIAISIAGVWFGEEAARGEIVGPLQGVVGPDAASLIQDMITNAGSSGSGPMATLVGVVTLVLGASGVFGQLQDALNTIWEVVPAPDRGVLGTIKDRLLSFAMVLGVGLLLLVTLMVSTGLSAVGNFVTNIEPALVFVWQIVNFAVSLGAITLSFAMIYKLLPDAKIAWGDVWTGAVATALLFVSGTFLIGLYLGRSSVGSAFGAAGSLVVILVWIYYSAQILFFGAEFTQVYARKHGSRIVPAEDATWAGPPPRGRDRAPRAKRVDRRERVERDRASRETAERAPKERHLAGLLSVVLGVIAFAVGRLISTLRESRN